MTDSREWRTMDVPFNGQRELYVACELRDLCCDSMCCRMPYSRVCRKLIGIGLVEP